jgi:hypothetical protein
MPSQDPEHADRSGPHPHSRIRRLESEYHRVQGFVVGTQRAGNVAVVGWKGGGAGQPLVKPDSPVSSSISYLFRLPRGVSTTTSITCTPSRIGIGWLDRHADA